MSRGASPGGGAPRDSGPKGSIQVRSISLGRRPSGCAQALECSPFRAKTKILTPKGFHALVLGVILALLLVLSACGRDAPPPEEPVHEMAPTPPPPPPPPASTPEEALRPVSVADAPALFDDGDRATLRRAVESSLRWLRRQRERSFVVGPRTVSAAEMAAGLSTFLDLLDANPTPEDLARQIPEYFELHESVGDWTGEMLITGYYEPSIAGSRRRTADYDIPIYGRPTDQIRVDLGQFSEEWEGRTIKGRLEGKKLVPYPSRREMREGNKPKSKVIAWARDPVELFFLEVQGSGTLNLPGGDTMRIGWAGGNGRKYRSIGRLLIDEGAIPKERMSMQALRAWLADNPDEIQRVLEYNDSVVFFRPLDGPPLGSLGLPVIPERSVAMDHKLFPSGALAFLETEIPAMGEDGATVSAGRLGRFVLNHDTGGAIRGADRADLFWGRGDLAAERAGLMKQPGRLVFLLPKASE